MNQNKNIQWHSALVSALKIEFKDFQNYLTYQEEFKLNTSPRRIDCLITKAANAPPFHSPLASIFLHYNIIDYKSPAESMNIQNFYKVLSYAYSLPDFFHDDNILKETTITLISNHFPKKLIRHLKDHGRTASSENLSGTSKDLVEKIIPGLYHIHIESIHPFPMQLIVLPQLPSEEHLWLHCLRNDLDETSPLKALRDEYRKHKDDSVYQSVMNTIIRANMTNKEEVDHMCEALYELFADELVKNKTIGIAEGKARGIAEGETRGENKISSLILKLIADNRNDEIQQMASDPKYRRLLLKQYNLG